MPQHSCIEEEVCETKPAKMDSIPANSSHIEMCQLVHREDLYQTNSSSMKSHLRVGVILKYMVRFIQHVFFFFPHLSLGYLRLFIN
jgi:hypothetical protein